MVDVKKKTRILVVFNSLMGGFGGASRHFTEVANYWRDSCDLDILISESGYKSMKKHVHIDIGKIILYSTPFDNSRNRILVYASRILKNVLMAPKINDDYDVIIAPNYLPQNMIPAIFFKRKKTKLVVYFHTVQPDLRIPYLKIMNFLQRFISILNWNLCVYLAKRFFDQIIVVNYPTKKYFLEKGFSSKKIDVVDNAIPYNLISNSPSEVKEYEGVFLSRLVKRKGVWDLIRIWKGVIDIYPSAKLCIIGDGPEKSHLNLKIEKEGLSNNIILMGDVSDEKKYKLLKSSKVFIFPSYYESWGIVIAEAIACRLPVVVYHLSIYDEIFNDYIFMVQMGNVSDMTKRIIDILQHPTDYETVIEESNKFISKFDWEIVAQQELSLVNSNI